MADLPNESISWLQNGEPVTGGSGGNSDGVLNRPLVEFLANDNFLQNRIDIVADDDGFVKKLLSTIKIGDADTGVTARVQFDSTGIRSYDGTNLLLDIQSSKYGLELGHGTVNQYGPLRIINAGVTGAANLHTTYPNAELDTIAVDAAHEAFIKNGASSWGKIGGVLDTPVSSVNITGTLSTASAVILDADGLTMRKAGSDVKRFLVLEDGSFVLGNAAGANLDFTTGDVMTLNTSVLTGCTIDGSTNTLSNLVHGTQVDNPTSGVHGVTGTLVGTTDIQTLEEKRLRDTNTYFDGVTNKKVNFSCANVTAGALKTVTFLDASGTMVLEDATQTLTNKSISGGQINSGTVAAARIDNLSANKITSDTFNVDRIPSLSANKITSDVLNIARIPDISGKNITLAGSTPNKIILDGSSWDTEIYGDATGSKVYVLPDTTKTVDLEMGSNTYLFDNIVLKGQDITINANNTGTSSASAWLDLGGSSGNITFECTDSAGTSTEQYYFTPDNGFYPNIGHPNLGGSGAEWGDFYAQDIHVEDIFADYLAISTPAGASISLTLGGETPTQAMLKVDPYGSAPTQTTGIGGIWWDSNCQQYIQITSTSGNTWKMFARENSTFRAGNYLYFTGDDSSPSFIGLNGTANQTQIFCNADGTYAYIIPRDHDETAFRIGTVTGGDSKFTNIVNYAEDYIQLQSGKDVTTVAYSSISVSASGGGLTSIKSKDTSDNEELYYFTPAEFRPNHDHVTDCATSSYAWDHVWSWNWDTATDFYYMDDRMVNGRRINISDLAIIESIKPGDKFDKNTGLRLIDDDSIPEWMLTKNKETGEISRTSTGEPFLDLKLVVSLNMGALREIHSKVNNNMGVVLERFNQLEARLAALE